MSDAKTTQPPLWTNSIADFSAATSQEEYSQIINKMGAQFQQNYPALAANTLILDPTKPTAEQFEGLLARAEQQQGKLSDADRQKAYQEFEENHSYYYENFAERGAKKGLNGLAFDAGPLHIIMPAPPDRLPKEMIEETIAHELNHIVVRASDNKPLDSISMTEDVRVEWSAVLAQYSYALASHPSLQTERDIRLHHLDEVVAVTNGAGTTAEHVGSYPYVLSEDAFSAVIQETKKRVAKGEKPSLTMANEIAAKILAEHGPDEQTVKSDITEIKALTKIKTDLYTQDQDNGRQYMADFHDTLATQQGSWAKRLHAAQNEKDQLLREAAPQATSQYAKTGELPTVARVPLRSLKVEEYNGIVNIETQNDFGPTSTVIGYNSKTGEALIGIDSDNNYKTGQSGFDVFYTASKEGKLYQSTTMDDRGSEVKTDAGVASTFAKHTAIAMNAHNNIASIDVKELQQLGLQLGAACTEVATGTHVSPAAGSASAPEKQIGGR